MKTRILFIDQNGNEDSLCETFASERDLFIEINLLKQNGCQVMGWMIL